MATVSTTLPSDGQTIDASDVNTPINAILSEFNGNIDNDNIKTGANINGAKLLASSLPGSALDTTLAGGWISGGLPAYSSATNNGNKSYDIVFASTVASLLSPGMRLRTTRTVTAPTQCADLEASSSQYFSKTSPNKLTFTDDYTTMAWVKLESYTLGGIIARRNADTEGFSFAINANGQVIATALRIAGNNSSTTSYQSIPLNKWVHVAATVNLSGTSVLLYIDGVLVPSSTSITGTITAIVQGTTALVVGAEKSAGTNPFDGKIAQAAVFDAVLSAATIRSYMSQGLSGTETNLLSAYSFNNAITDLNTTTPNDLTQSGGAAATATDSPFGQDSNGVTAGTTDHALVMKVSTTTATVQVPEGCTIPTSGGVSAVAYSTATSPFGFTLDKGRWEVNVVMQTRTTKATPVNGTVYNYGDRITVPVGQWLVGYSVSCYMSTTTAQQLACYVDLDPTAVTGTYPSSTGTAWSATSQWAALGGYTNGVTDSIARLSRESPLTLSTATTYNLNQKAQMGGGTGASSAFVNDLAGGEIYAIPAGV